MNNLPKILVVDDIAANRLAIRTALRSLDATLVEATNGFDALAITLEEDLALILLDVQMPEMDGFEVCERLRANPQTADTPVIFVSAANKADEDRIHGYLSGATDYLSKPIHDHILRAKTQVFLRLYRQNRELQAALAAAQAADRAKDAFLANVSHELRTPLNAVIGLSALARRSSTDARQREYLDKVNDAGQTLLAIINDLLDLTKIAAGELQFEATPFSLRQTAARVLSVIGHLAAGKGLLLYGEIDETLPDVLVGDPLRIEQILLNLLNNAIKFTESGRIVVRVGLAELAGQRVRLQIEVEDSGIGMSDDEISQIYKPFVQADPSISRKHGGTGLGLAICKQLAEGMDGAIEVSSRPGQGTRFLVRLSLGLASTDDLLPADDPTGGQDLPTRYCDARVLVVDDQPLNREVVFDLLGTVGIVPDLAENGQQAVDILSESGPGAFDLVLMDIQMPIMDGLTAVRRIRALPGFAELPIVAMTAHTMVHEKQGHLAEGMNDHLGKPFSLPSFFALLAKWLTQRAVPISEPPALDGDPASDNQDKVGLAAISGLDSAAGLARFAGNSARYRHWLSEFVGESAGFAAAIDALLARGAREAARQATHAFKGRVGMLGMHDLHHQATLLEKAIRAGKASNTLREQLAKSIETMSASLQAAIASTAVALATAQATPVAAATRTGGPLPPSIAALLELLAAADGGSAAAIEAALAELPNTHWSSLLQAALLRVRSFDFEAARRILADAP